MLLASAACIMLPAQRREDSLMRTAREFNDGLRWGREEEVTSCLSPVEAKGLQTRRADLGEDFVMADQEVKSVKVLPDADKATVVAEFTWFNQRHAILQRSTIEQKWEWSDSHWVVASWRRVAGDRFPLVPEPLASARH